MAAPDWVTVLQLAQRWNCPPWEIDESHTPLYWMVRQIRLDTIVSELNG